MRSEGRKPGGFSFIYKNYWILVLLFLAVLCVGLYFGLSPSSDPPTDYALRIANYELDPEHASGVLQVHMLDVGHGDCLLLISPSGSTMLVDAGDRGMFEEVLDDYLQERGIEKLDIVLHSHAHADHIGGMEALLASDYEIGCYLRPGADAGKPTKLYERLLATLAKADYPTYALSAGEPSPLGGWDEAVSVQVLSPQPGASYSNVNDTSLVLHVAYGQTSLLLTGDAQRAAERDMLAAYGDGVHATLLKVGHHSSTTSSTKTFLRGVAADYAFISCGADYGNPKPDTLARLSDYGIPPQNQFITLHRGTVVAYLDGTTITFTTEK